MATKYNVPVTMSRGAPGREPTAPIDDAVALRVAVARIHRQLRTRIDHSLTQSQISALARLEQSGPSRLGPLAELEGVTAPTMSKIVDQLVDRGLVARTSDRDDARASQLRVTERGMDVLVKARSVTTDALRSGLASLTASERARIRQALPAIERLGELLLEPRGTDVR